ncbi:MAG TPA: hypothetical protein VKE70_24885 [Candidatus Solibacter sp.]|nr:hypothetical protein [Candidatus Solibacter sp.]
MKKGLAICALMAACTAIVFADDKGGKVFTALEESLTVLSSPSPRPGPGVASPEVKVLATDISLDETSDLLITPSLITAILARTENDGARGPSENAQALETINIVVRVDGVAARPGPVVYDSITRTVTTKFGGVIPTTCMTIDSCTLTDEQLIEVLNISAAHSFTFFVKGVGKGQHHVEVSASFINNDQASPVTTPPPSTNPFASATSSATIGSRTLVVVAVASKSDNNNDRNERDNVRFQTHLGQSVSHIIDRLQNLYWIR